MLRRTLIAGLMLFSTATAFAEIRSIDLTRSRVTVLVGKTGLFSSLGDEHIIEAPLSSGRVDAHARTAELAFHSDALKVIDPKLPAEKRTEVQRRMLSREVIDASRFPEIQFQSTNVQESGSDQWEVTGVLTLHGERHPVTVRVTLVEGHYKGSAAIKQTWFGIKPVSVGGGTVKVKDELQLKFEIVMATATN